jgi:arylsulfatase A-like enzyme
MRLVRIIAPAAVLATLLCAHPLRAAEAPRPNIVLVMADDMGYSDVGWYGGEIRTPSIDGLAAGGLSFSHFYNTARCCPTRASLMTGLYPHQAGIGHMMDETGLEGYAGDLNDRCVTIAEVLRTAGYGTYLSGKWHVTRHKNPDSPRHNWPRQRGFDRSYGMITGAGSFYDPPTLTLDNRPLPSPAGDYYFTDAVTDHAVEFVQQHRRARPDDPFFLYVAYTSPHWPLHALAEDVARYRGRYDQGWDALREERYRRMVDKGLVRPEWGLTIRDEGVEAWDAVDHKEWQTRRMEVYAAQIDRMDQGIGRLIRMLEKDGLLDRTLILFLADNGACAEELTADAEWVRNITPKLTRDGRPVHPGNDPAVMPGPETTYQSYGLPWANVSNTPFREYKHWVHEGGISTPLIAHWPRGIRARGEWTSQVGHLVDIMATCVDVAGARYPRAFRGNRITPMEGTSLAPVLAGGSPSSRAVYFEHEGNRAVRLGRWKLVSRADDDPFAWWKRDDPGPGNWELFDLEADRTETDNLASERPDLVQSLAELWHQWALRTDALPYPEKTWN